MTEAREGRVSNEKHSDKGSVEERIALLKSLKGHLIAQRDKFEQYLDLLDRQEESIQSGDMERLQAHIELEKGIIEEIYAFQKVIDPLTEVYRMAYPASEPEIPLLSESLEHARQEVLARNERNRSLLKKNLETLRQEIASLRIPKRAKSPYGDVGVPSMIDITT